MKNCLEEYKNHSVNDIAEKYIEGTPQIAELPVLPDETNATNGTMITGAKNEDATLKIGRAHV